MRAGCFALVLATGVSGKDIAGDGGRPGGGWGRAALWVSEKAKAARPMPSLTLSPVPPRPAGSCSHPARFHQEAPLLREHHPSPWTEAPPLQACRPLASCRAPARLSLNQAGCLAGRDKEPCWCPEKSGLTIWAGGGLLAEGRTLGPCSSLTRLARWRGPSL